MKNERKEMGIRRRISWFYLPFPWIWRGCWDWRAAWVCWQYGLGLRKETGLGQRRD